ncbi:putative MscS family protein [Erysiphe neolycopersici]|uniref:Putative MscS family protein n=1 Tax=Erysiphe neolycopersici TaxID=212602 RepID=A0A420HW43_9PEZI|nr:putative MscS family protein [Erysiphe neolycopersici]
MKDSEFELSNTSGYRTPMAYVNLAGKNVRHAFTKVSDVAGKVAGDFTGQAVQTSTHPRQVVLQLIHTNNGSQVLARRLYRTFAHETRNTVLSDDLKSAFDNEEEAHAAFSMFDKDLNGDISMEELEAVCVEIGRERKGITASLKDLDSVVSKLDQVFLFIVSIITILVFLSLISASASVILTSAGSTILALSWLLQATAQEFLQSIIFVFVKHPFDVGDRVTIYGNTGKTLTGDDYFVKGISLLYTEFKKMEGHIVQAPNSYLNTIFVLNQRRSGGLAEAVPVTVKFGTTLEQIDTLRQRLLEFVTLENREYQQNILTELTTIYEAYSVTLNIVFFYKSNWQNELLRLQRRNKFICAMMVSMNELGIEGPRMLLAGAAEEYPLYLHGAYPNANINPSAPNLGPFSTTPENSNITSSKDMRSHTPPIIPRSRHDIMKFQRGESFLDIQKHTDLSLGMSSINSSTNYADAFTDHEPICIPPTVNPSSRTYHSSTDRIFMARTSSRDSTGSGSKRRFMSLRKHTPAHDERTRYDDLEVGTPNHTMHDVAEVRPELLRSSTQYNFEQK